MASTIDKIKNDIIEAMNASQKRTSAYDTEAEIVRVDGNTAWVHIAGGVTETPVALTINAKKGDKVQVRVTNGGAWIMGNATAPPTDDAKANEADKKAAEAKYLAVDAADAAIKADIAAQDAVSSAETARTAAETAQETAESVEGIALQAQEDATAAQESAETANDAASSALTGLSMVESVVGVLNWVSTHATYQLTADEDVVNGKWYFTYDAVNNEYEVVPNPTGDPSAQGWYEIASIDEAVQDYLTSHLALTDNGLWLQTDNVASKLLLSNTEGLVIYGENGPLAKYGTDAVIGDESAFHLKINGTEIGFYQAAQKVAYINGNKLYITQSVVLQQMDVGTPTADGGLGQWSWKVHEVNGQNNLYLKWLG